MDNNIDNNMDNKDIDAGLYRKSTIGKRIMLLRELNNYTRQQLADELGVSAQTISNYENDKTKPNIKAVTDMAMLFKVSINLILYGYEPVEREKLF